MVASLEEVCSAWVASSSPDSEKEGQRDKGLTCYCYHFSPVLSLLQLLVMLPRTLSRAFRALRSAYSRCRLRSCRDHEGSPRLRRRSTNERCEIHSLLIFLTLGERADLLCFGERSVFYAARIRCYQIRKTVSLHSVVFLFLSSADRFEVQIFVMRLFIAIL